MVAYRSGIDRESNGNAPSKLFIERAERIPMLSQATMANIITTKIIVASFWQGRSSAPGWHLETKQVSRFRLIVEDHVQRGRYFF